MVENIKGELRTVTKKRNVTLYGMAKAIVIDPVNRYKSSKGGSNLELNKIMKVLNNLDY